MHLTLLDTRWALAQRIQRLPQLPRGHRQATPQGYVSIGGTPRLAPLLLLLRLFCCCASRQALSLRWGCGQGVEDVTQRAQHGRVRVHIAAPRTRGALCLGLGGSIAGRLVLLGCCRSTSAAIAALGGSVRAAWEGDGGRLEPQQGLPEGPQVPQTLYDDIEEAVVLALAIAQAAHQLQAAGGRALATLVQHDAGLGQPQGSSTDLSPGRLQEVPHRPGPWPRGGHRLLLLHPCLQTAIDAAA
mmetsp:Transcript_16108/g.43908  ORF Transcript_16108/g.43908 Transcript_16108/m.43908 type:complete len:243 (-) Transcript_16108:2777-3505(-)